MQYIHYLITGEWIDEVTRLPNKKFAERVIEELKKSAEEFFALNIRLDFLASDQSTLNFVLSRVSSVIKHSVRIPKDFVFKLDDKNFLIIIHGISEGEAQKISQRIKDSLHYLLLTYGPQKIQVNCEIEISKIGGVR
ncbi:MAG: diguanylate cyclase [Fervidobacterium sp.]